MTLLVTVGKVNNNKSGDSKAKEKRLSRALWTWLHLYVNGFERPGRKAQGSCVAGQVARVEFFNAQLPHTRVEVIVTVTLISHL